MENHDNNKIDRMAAELADSLSVNTNNREDLNAEEQSQFDQLKIISQVALMHRRIKLELNPEMSDQRTKKSVSPLFIWGRLSVLELIGSGAFGDVYRARDDILERDVALKLLRTETEQPLNTQAFIAEAKRMARVRHPNVLAIHGANIHDQRAGFWADLLDGYTIDLSESYGQEGLDVLLHFTRQVAAGLQAIHRSGLIHGDIKPSNIMLEADGRYIIMDFGAGLNIAESADLSGYLHGSPALMAPELFTQQHSGAPVDVYALGATLFKMATGTYPVAGNDILELQQNHQHKRQLKLSQLRPDLPKELVNLVTSMLDSDAELRPDCEHILRSLYAIETAPQRRRNRLAVGAIVSLLVMGTAASSWGFYQATKAKETAIMAQQKTASINEFLQDMLSAGSELGGGIDVRVADVLDKAAEKLAQNPNTDELLAVDMHQSLADSYNAIRLPDKALSHAESSLALALLNLPADSETVTAARLQKIKALQLLDRHEASIDAVDQLLAVAENSLGSDHWYIQRAKKHKINNLYSMAKYQEALDYLEQNFQEIPDPKTASNNFGYELLQLKANGHWVKGDFTKSTETFKQALAWLEAYPKPNLLNVNTTTAGLGLAQLESGEIEAGVRNLEKALDLTIQVHGKNTESHLEALVNLGAAQRMNKQPKLAQQTTMQAYELAKSIYQNKPHRQTIAIGTNLANMLVDLGDVEQGEVIMRESLDMAYQVLGDKRPETLIIEYNLAELLNNQGRHQEALEWAISTASKKAEAFGEDHIYTLLSQDNWAISLSGLEQHQEAAEKHQQVVDAMLTKIRAKHQYTLLVRQHQADTLRSAGFNQPLQELLPALVADLAEALGPDDAVTLKYSQLMRDL